MPTREQISELLDVGHSFETAARELAIPAGRAFMIATGMPADGSDTPTPEQLAEKRRDGSGSTQGLVNPPAFNPTSKRSVIEWVRVRAAQELGAQR